MKVIALNLFHGENTVLCLCKKRRGSSASTHIVCLARRLRCRLSLQGFHALYLDQQHFHNSIGKSTAFPAAHSPSNWSRPKPLQNRPETSQGATPDGQSIIVSMGEQTQKMAINKPLTTAINMATLVTNSIPQPAPRPLGTVSTSDDQNTTYTLARRAWANSGSGYNKRTDGDKDWKRTDQTSENSREVRPQKQQVGQPKRDSWKWHASAVAITLNETCQSRR